MGDQEPERWGSFRNQHPQRSYKSYMQDYSNDNTHPTGIRMRVRSVIAQSAAGAAFASKDRAASPDLQSEISALSFEEKD